MVDLNQKKKSRITFWYFLVIKRSNWKWPINGGFSGKIIDKNWWIFMDFPIALFDYRIDILSGVLNFHTSQFGYMMILYDII